MADLTIKNLEVQIGNVAENLATQTNRINLHLVDSDSKINNINNNIARLDNEDVEIHNEIHTLSVAVDNNTDKVEQLEEHIYNYDEVNTEIRGTISDIQEEMAEMDEEHHEELHRLAEAIDAHTTRMDAVEEYTTKIPQHIVLSEEEYEKLGAPDEDKFYFVYEQE